MTLGESGKYKYNAKEGYDIISGKNKEFDFRFHWHCFKLIFV